jgi:uncharacterized protein (TIGR02147 family)
MYPDFKDFDELGSLISPPSTGAETKRSVALLERLGLVIKNEFGRDHITDKVISSGPHEKALAIANFQRETMKMAQESLDRFEKTQRDISTMTIGISDVALIKIQQLLQETRRRIADIAAEDGLSGRVYQLNMQLFPFSKQIPVQKKDVEV